MPARRATGHLIERLPPVRGRLSADAPLAPVTWFRVGGPAEVMFRPADPEDLAAFLAAKPADVPVTVIGVASNLLVRDGGVKGVVVRLGRGFVDIKVEDTEIEAGAGALDINVALTCQQAGVAGLEFMSGIPGTVGGGLRMNAGAYGREIKDVLVNATALDPLGGRHTLELAALGLGYRHCDLPEDWIFIAARFAGSAGDVAEIGRRMSEIQSAREASQPIRARTGGSTFANPPGHKAWELIDRAGCRGLTMGGAAISEKHANFLINTGAATAAELEALGEEVRRRVFETTGIRLRWEIRRLGEPAEEPV
ncbi:MAG TPA: UDP-N-acetylmuramate dehydrogenase [Stellaceae bacterium]|nr:UDP-N-acetylmuramate dehydrogenase [Stellaceae bacterium]